MIQFISEKYYLETSKKLDFITNFQEKIVK